MNASILVAVLTCAVLSTLTDALSTQFWKKPSWPLGIAFVSLSPFVFLAFGYVGSKFGLSVASSLTNSLIVIGPIVVGLIVFGEWQKMTIPLYIGLGLIVAGIIIIAIYRTD